jgi:hypothetical protein
MKKFVLALATVPMFGTASLLANAITPEMAKAPVTETLPAGAQVMSLEVQPAKVVINGRYEAAQLIITAKLASGDSLDVTRIAKLQATGAVAEVTPLGQVKPLAGGDGSIRVALGDKSATVPVEVTNMKEAQPVDFIRDVNPVMTKLGCNAGACHGAKEGKYGFKLSLRATIRSSTCARSRTTSPRAA